MEVKSLLSNTDYEIKFNHNSDEKVTGVTIFKNKRFLHALTFKVEEVKTIGQKVIVDIKGASKDILAATLQHLPGVISVSMGMNTRSVEIFCNNSRIMANVIFKTCLDKGWSLLRLDPQKEQVIKSQFCRDCTRKEALTKALKEAGVPRQDRYEIFEVYRMMTKVPRWSKSKPKGVLGRLIDNRKDLFEASAPKARGRSRKVLGIF